MRLWCPWERRHQVPQPLETVCVRQVLAGKQPEERQGTKMIGIIGAIAAMRSRMNRNQRGKEYCIEDIFAPVATLAHEANKTKLKAMLDPGAKMPTRAHSTDAGLDLYSRENWLIMPGMSRKFDTGVHISIPAGYVGMVKSKSGLNVNHGITSEGVIDSGYTGSIMVKLYNHGRNTVKIEQGQKISQLVIMPIITPDLELVDSLEDTERGGGGFGSTGAF